MTAEEALRFVIDCFEKHNLNYMITGSFASNLHGVPRSTHDADIIIEAASEKIEDILKELMELFYADNDAAKRAIIDKRIFNIIHYETGFKIDLVVRKERAFSDQEFQRRQQYYVLDRQIWFASPEDVILAKLEWAKISNSVKQFDDALGIVKVQSNKLDISYLLKWAKALEISELFDNLLSKANL